MKAIIQKLLGKQQKSSVDIEKLKLALSACLVHTKGPSPTVKARSIGRYLGIRMGELTRDDGKKRFWIMGESNSDAALDYCDAINFTLARYLIRHTKPEHRELKLDLFTKQHLTKFGISTKLDKLQDNQPHIWVYPTPKTPENFIAI